MRKCKQFWDKGLNPITMRIPERWFPFDEERHMTSRSEEEQRMKYYKAEKNKPLK